MNTTPRPLASATSQLPVANIAPKSERETIEQFVNLIRTAPSEKQFIQLIDPAEWLLDTCMPGFFSGFKQRAVAKPKDTLLALADVLTWFLEDTERTHYLMSELNLSTPEAQEVESKVAKISKRRI